MELKNMKLEAIEKFSQGDVNIYLLQSIPSIKTEAHESPTIVIGQSGNHHKLIGEGFEIGKIETGQFIVKVSGKKVALAHAQHKPPIKLKPGVYLMDRALEKGMFSDMIAPVVD